jgi:PBSX family phage terminase large subunit
MVGKNDITIEFDLLGFLPKQMKVIDSCEIDNAILYSGAFRAGKTLLLVYTAIKTCLENPECEGMLLADTTPHLYGVVFNLFRQTIDKLQRAINDEGLELKLLRKMIRSSGKMEVVFYNGAKIYFRACDDERKLSGYTLDFFGIDEPVDVDEGIFTQLMGRISGTGNLENRFALLTTNPADEMHWVYKYFYLMDEEGFSHVDTTTYDNKLLPNYHNYIKRLESMWDEDWVRRYLNGKWGMFEGAIYKEFNPERHIRDVRDAAVEYHIASVDWGLRHNFSLIIAGITSDNRIIVKEEIANNNMTSMELSKLIAEKHKEYKFKKMYFDPSAADLIQQCYDLGLPAGRKTKTGIKSFADNDVSSGISKVKAMFKNNSVIIDKRCTQLIKEIKAYRFKEGTEKPIKKNDDSVDSFRYLVTDFNPFKESGFFGVLHYKINKWGQ